MSRLILVHSVVIIIMFSNIIYAQNSLAERLGYSPEDKLLIIHADDMAVAHSENAASILAMKVGMVNSGSIMMTCPWTLEIAEYAKANPDHDLGLHLTLTAEWKHIKWGPLAGAEQVPSIVNEYGYFFDNCLEFGQKASLEDAAKELRAQVEQAIRMGINPTHLDTHMGCLIFNSPELFEVYLKLGREYKIPVMVDRFLLQAAGDAFQSKMTKDDVIIDRIFMANPDNYKSGMADYYESAIKSMTGGVNILLIHLAFNDAEMQAMTIDHPDYGAEWRQQDFDFFTSARCQQILDQENIKLITWKDIGAIMYER